MASERVSPGSPDAVMQPHRQHRLGDDRMATLKELAAMKEQGILTDEEFATEKAKILAS